MEHIFLPEQEEITSGILESINTAKEASEILLAQISSDDWNQFAEITSILRELIISIMNASLPYQAKLDRIILPTTCKCALGSLNAICKAANDNHQKCISKLQFELIPIFEEAYMQFYFWAHVYTYPEREKQYYEKEIYDLASNKYINASIESGIYKYDVCFMVLAYNKLEYTKKCVENLLKYIPQNLNYELILWDNGSSDDTVSYFESKNPTKLLESRINWGIGRIAPRITESRLIMSISNDVIITPMAIDNMLSCIDSSDDIAYVVPATSNICNAQIIQADYSSYEEMIIFSEKNNECDPYRWETRTRLVNPISLSKTKDNYSKYGICNNGYLEGSTLAFPDDRLSLLYRRKGKKLILAKDSFCHHYGSVTLSDEFRKIDQEQLYIEGRHKFKDKYGIDPWGLGFCYERFFLNRIVDDETEHIDILGINCGIGSNSLKIKEQIKEYCHNTDCTLVNITDDINYLPDLSGISDKAGYITELDELTNYIADGIFKYIVWESEFLNTIDFVELFSSIYKHLHPNGTLIIKDSEQNKKWISAHALSGKRLDKSWIKIYKNQIRK